MAGFFGGSIDNLIMRFTDILLSIPLLLLLITAASLFQPALKTTIIVIGFSSWPGTARLVRGQFMALKDQEFVTAARATGATSVRIMARHLFPNSLAVIIVQATIWLSYAILLEASLSYLGLGVKIPTPSLGQHAAGRPARTAGRRLVADRLPRRRDLPDRALLQPHGRRPARRLRPPPPPPRFRVSGPFALICRGGANERSLRRRRTFVLAAATFVRVALSDSSALVELAIRNDHIED